MSIFDYIPGVANTAFWKKPKMPSPSAAASPYFNQISEMGKEQLNPYVQQGRESGQLANNRYNQMTQNPVGLHDEIMSSYKPSTGFEFKHEQARKALASTAAAGGFRGNEQDQIAQGDLLNKMLSQDQGEYFDRIYSILNGGLQGQELNAGRGFEANNALTGLLGGNLATQGGLAYQQQSEKNSQEMEFRKMLRELILGGLGGAVGGPAGAMAGANVGGGNYSYSPQQLNQQYGGGNF